MLKPRPDFLARVHAWGRSLQKTGEGEASVGGTFGQPDLALSYLLASRIMIEAATAESHLREVALPIVYQQRHSFELALKDVLATAYDIAASEAWLKALKVDEKAVSVRAKKVPNTHDFDELLGLLEKALDAIGRGPLPSEIEAVARRLREIERVATDEEANLQRIKAVAPDRLRYATLTDGRRTFPEPVTLHVEEMQTLIEDVFAKFFVYQHNEYENPNFITTLAIDTQAADQQILYRIGTDRYLAEA